MLRNDIFCCFYVPTCVDEELDELSVSHEKLWNEVDIPVPAPAVGLLVRGRLTELGEELLQRGDGGRLAPVVFVPVHVENLLTGDRKHARQDTLGEASPQDDTVVFLIHRSKDREG